MRIVLATLVYLLSAAAIAILASFMAILLAGPHAGLLPSWLEPVVWALCALAVLALPVLLARKVWRH